MEKKILPSVLVMAIGGIRMECRSHPSTSEVAQQKQSPSPSGCPCHGKSSGRSCGPCKGSPRIFGRSSKADCSAQEQRCSACSWYASSLLGIAEARQKKVEWRGRTLHTLEGRKIFRPAIVVVQGTEVVFSFFLGKGWRAIQAFSFEQVLRILVRILLECSGGLDLLQLRLLLCDLAPELVVPMH